MKVTNFTRATTTAFNGEIPKNIKIAQAIMPPPGSVRPKLVTNKTTSTKKMLIIASGVVTATLVSVLIYSKTKKKKSKK